MSEEDKNKMLQRATQLFFQPKLKLIKFFNAWTSWIHKASSLILFCQKMHWAEPIAGPFPNVAHHVVQSPVLNRKTQHNRPCV